MINGTDQIRRNIVQGIRKDPPPFCATILEKRQIFPVPTAMPIVAIIRAHREEKNSSCFIESIIINSNMKSHTYPSLRVIAVKFHCIAVGF